jgi:hypothetical protein
MLTDDQNSTQVDLYNEPGFLCLVGAHLTARLRARRATTDVRNEFPIDADILRWKRRVSFVGLIEGVRKRVKGSD